MEYTIFTYPYWKNYLESLGFTYELSTKINMGLHAFAYTNYILYLKLVRNMPHPNGRHYVSFKLENKNLKTETYWTIQGTNPTDKETKQFLEAIINPKLLLLCVTYDWCRNFIAQELKETYA